MGKFQITVCQPAHKKDGASKKSQWYILNRNTVFSRSNSILYDFANGHEDATLHRKAWWWQRHAMEKLKLSKMQQKTEKIWGKKECSPKETRWLFSRNTMIDLHNKSVKNTLGFCIFFHLLIKINKCGGKKAISGGWLIETHQHCSTLNSQLKVHLLNYIFHWLKKPYEFRFLLRCLFPL